MVKDPDRLLSLAYATGDVRTRLELLFALDEALADVLRTVREAMIAQIRLAWWRDQLSALASGQVVAPEPLLLQIGGILRPAEAAALADLPSAWELLLQDPLTAEAVTHFAELRGGVFSTVFNSPALTKPLAFWALIDFAFHCSDARLAEAVATAAGPLNPERLSHLPRAVRVLVGLAQDDLTSPETRRPGSPRRMLRAFRHAFMTS